MANSAERTLKQRLLSGGKWVVIGKFVTAGSTFLLTMVLARLLDESELGTYYLAYKLIWLSSMLALMGLPQTAVRLIAESIGKTQPGRARSAVHKAYGLAILGVLIVAGGLSLGGGRWLALAANQPLLAGIMWVVGIWAAFHSLQVLTSEIFRGFQDLRLATIFGGAISGAITVATLIAIWFMGVSISLPMVLLVIIGAAVLSLALGLLLLRRKVVRLGPRTPLAWKTILGISVPLWINVMMAYGLSQSDLLILGLFRGAREVAVYGNATTLVSLVLMSLMLVNLVVPPFIAELHAKGEHRRLERMLRLTATLAGLPALVILTTFLLFGSQILGFAYGAEYAAGGIYLAILSLGRLAVVFMGSCAMTLSMTGHQTTLMRITIITSVLTIAASLLVAREYGGVGLATTTTAGLCVQSLWLLFSVRRLTGMWTHMSIPRLDDVKQALGFGKNAG
jgi:O-antigen/teichoic acid export membrane protein